MHPLRRPHSPASTPKGRAGPSGTARQRGRPSSPQHGEAQLGRVTQEPAGRRQGDSRHGQARAGVEGWGRRQQKERKKKSGRPKSRRKGGVDSPVRDTRKIDVTPDGNKQREPKVRLPASRLSGSAVAELRRRELARLGMAWRSPAPRWAGTRQTPAAPRAACDPRPRAGAAALPLAISCRPTLSVAGLPDYRKPASPHPYWEHQY